MRCLLHRALRFGGLAGFMVLLCVGFVGVTSRVAAADPDYGKVWFLLGPENDEEPYACVGRPVKGDFFAGVPQEEPGAPDPFRAAGAAADGGNHRPS